MLDRHQRSIHYLRISVTDRCNLRCTYCMPEQGVPPLRHEEILSYEEILRLTGLFARLGINRVRLTGGEPLVRSGLDTLVKGIKEISGIRQIGLTTNGILLREQLPALMHAGLDAVNISLDTLDPAQYRLITRRDALAAALEGLTAALATPSLHVKVNCVPTDENSDQWVALAELARENPAIELRFIELMPIGQGAHLSRRNEQEVLARLEHAFGHSTPCPQERGGGPGQSVTFPGFAGRIGFISAVSHCFCAACNRIRLTATGMLKPCLQYESSTDLRSMLRAGADDAALLAVLAETIYHKPAAHHFGGASLPGDEACAMHQIGG